VSAARLAPRAGRARESPPPTALAVTHGHDPHQRNTMEEPGPPPPAGAPHQHQSPMDRRCGLFGCVEFIGRRAAAIYAQQRGARSSSPANSAVCCCPPADLPPPPPAEKSEFDQEEGGGGNYTRSQSLEAGSFAVFIGGKRIPVRTAPAALIRSFPTNIPTPLAGEPGSWRPRCRGATVGSHRFPCRGLGWRWRLYEWRRLGSCSSCR
jgi:hypothetical protein